LIGSIRPEPTAVSFHRLTDAMDMHADLMVKLVTGEETLNDHAVGGQ